MFLLCINLQCVILCRACGSWFSLFPDSDGGFVRSIVIGATPLVPGRVGGAVIAFEITVMELVVEVSGIDDTCITYFQLLKARV